MKASHMNSYDWERERNKALYKQEQFLQKNSKVKEPKYKQYPQEPLSSRYVSWQKGKPLTDDEWENFFWNKLVPLGWLINNKTIVLPCPRCNTILEQIDIKQVRDQLYDIDYYKRSKAMLRCKECKNVPMP